MPPFALRFKLPRAASRRVARGFVRAGGGGLWAAMLALGLGMPSAASAQVLKYPEPWFLAIHPAGGQRGTSVPVSLYGYGMVEGESKFVIEGPPGVSAREIKHTRGVELQAVLDIAPDAPVGQRTIRVYHPRYGLTNTRFFHVGDLPEVVEEADKTVSASQAQRVATPVIINGRIDQLLDVDYYTFDARTGQRIVAAIVAHRMDSFTDFRQGYLDTNLELIDASGRTLAADEDSLGLDPLLQVKIPADGAYTLIVRSLGFKGSHNAVYRLTLGEVPYPTAIFPAGGRRGETIEVEVSGPNVPAGTRQRVTISDEGVIPTQMLTFDIASSTGRTLPIARGTLIEALEVEPNDQQSQAQSFVGPVTVNGRFLASDDIDDWYHIKLAAGQGLEVEIQAQRHIESPVDTEVHVFDAAGKLLGQNDDGAPFGPNVQCSHDFDSSDSFLLTPPNESGEYWVRVRNVGGVFGPQAIYRLHLRPLQPELMIYQWPAEMPIWGPGGTATFVVECLKWGGIDSDVQFTVEDLPTGWRGSVANWPAGYYPGYNAANAAVKFIVSITAPADANIGDMASFRVFAVGQAKDQTVRREARYLTLYGNSHNDRMHVRPTEQARVIIANPLDCQITSEVRELRGKVGQTLEIPVNIQRLPGAQGSLGLVVNGPTPSAGCGLGAPVTLPNGVERFNLPLTLPELPPGRYSVVVARSWASDLRNGRPGPCTPLIDLHIAPADGK